MAIKTTSSAASKLAQAIAQAKATKTTATISKADPGTSSKFSGTTIGGTTGSAITGSSASSVKDKAISSAKTTGVTSTPTGAKGTSTSGISSSSSSGSNYQIVSEFGKGIATGAEGDANEAKVKNDAEFRASEMARTIAVINDRKAAGLDTTAQTNYYLRMQQYQNEASQQQQQQPLVEQPLVEQPLVEQPLVEQPQQTSWASENAKIIQSIYDNLQKSQEAQIDNTTNQTVGNYTEQIDEAPSTYNQLRSDQDITTARQIQQQNQIAAQNNLTYSRGAASDLLGAQAAGQQNKTAYTVEEQNLISSLKRAIIEAQQSGELQKIASNADLRAQQANAMLTQGNADRSFSLQEAGLTGQYNGQSTLAKQSLDSQTALSEAGLTGQYNGQSTLAKQSLDSQTAISEAGLTGTYNGQDTLAKQSMDAAAERWEKEFGLSALQFETSVKQWNATYAENVRQADLKNGQWWTSFNDSKSRADTKLAWDMQMDKENLALNQEKMAWAMSEENPENIAQVIKNTQAASGLSPNGQDALDHVFTSVIPEQMKILGDRIDMYGEGMSVEDYFSVINDASYKAIYSYPGLTEYERKALVLISMAEDPR